MQSIAKYFHCGTTFLLNSDCIRTLRRHLNKLIKVLPPIKFFDNRWVCPKWFRLPNKVLKNNNNDAIVWALRLCWTQQAEWSKVEGIFRGFEDSQLLFGHITRSTEPISKFEMCDHEYLHKILSSPLWYIISISQSLQLQELMSWDIIAWWSSHIRWLVAKTH